MDVYVQIAREMVIDCTVPLYIRINSIILE